MNNLNWIDTYNNAATKIQSGFRGHKVRKDKHKEIENLKGQAKVLETYRTDKYMIDQF